MCTFDPLLQHRHVPHLQLHPAITRPVILRIGSTVSWLSLWLSAFWSSFALFFHKLIIVSLCRFTRARVAATSVRRARRSFARCASWATTRNTSSRRLTSCTCSSRRTFVTFNRSSTARSNTCGRGRRRWILSGSSISTRVYRYVDRSVRDGWFHFQNICVGTAQVLINENMLTSWRTSTFHIAFLHADNTNIWRWTNPSVKLIFDEIFYLPIIMHSCNTGNRGLLYASTLQISRITHWDMAFLRRNDARVYYFLLKKN